MVLLRLLVPALLASSLVAEDAFDVFWADAQQAPKAAKSAASQQRLAWWRDARFGMFIHWNMSSVAACEISWAKEFHDGIGEDLRPNPRPSAGSAAGRMAQEVNTWSHLWMRPPVPGAVYDQLHRSFYPGQFDADALVAKAKAAGMRYIVQVAKHHDGFCMFDSRFTDYDIMATPFHRDIVAEMATACAKAGMPYGIYYSQRDWHHPDYRPATMGAYNQYMRQQIQELLEAHPTIRMVWFDAGGYPGDLWEAKELFRLIHRLRPDVVINNRCGPPADFSTPEQRLGSFDLARDWESCMTFTGFWSWHGFQTTVIPFEQCLTNLIRCAGGGGNLLMNVGPMPTGQIDPREGDRLARTGAWLAANGASIYGTDGGPYKPGDYGVTTSKGQTIYLHLLNTAATTFTFPALRHRVTASSLLGGGTPQVQQNDAGLTVTIADQDRQPVDTIVVLTLDGPAATALTP